MSKAAIRKHGGDQLCPALAGRFPIPTATPSARDRYLAEGERATQHRSNGIGAPRSTPASSCACGLASLQSPAAFASGHLVKTLDTSSARSD